MMLPDNIRAYENKKHVIIKFISMFYKYRSGIPIGLYNRTL